jgi:hypothetical protein
MSVLFTALGVGAVGREGSYLLTMALTPLWIIVVVVTMCGPSYLTNKEKICRKYPETTSSRPTTPDQRRAGQ